MEILQASESQMQRITVEATEKNGMVQTLNRGGARLVLQKASDLAEAFRIAKDLGIETVE